jgi:phosphoribosylformylglycinamidine (FGAM) synthase-like enzyme
MHQVIKVLIQNKLIQSAHDVADGGLYITLLESAMPNQLGFDVETDSDFRKDAFLFGEAQGRVVVSVASENQEAFIELMATVDTDFSLLGTVTLGELSIDEASFGNVKVSKKANESVLHDILGE